MPLLASCCPIDSRRSALALVAVCFVVDPSLSCPSTAQSVAPETTPRPNRRLNDVVDLTLWSVVVTSLWVAPGGTLSPAWPRRHPVCSHYQKLHFRTLSIFIVRLLVYMALLQAVWFYSWTLTRFGALLYIYSLDIWFRMFLSHDLWLFALDYFRDIYALTSDPYCEWATHIS